MLKKQVELPSIPLKSQQNLIRIEVTLGNFSPLRAGYRLTFTAGSAFGYQQFIGTPTRKCRILDWALTNILIAVFSHGIVDPVNNFDYNPIFTEFQFSFQRFTVTRPLCIGFSKPFIVWGYGNSNFSDFDNALHVIPWEYVITNSSSVDFVYHRCCKPNIQSF